MKNTATDNTYQDNLNKYVEQVVNIIVKEIADCRKFTPKYVYSFGKPLIPGHPPHPPYKPQFKYLYKNDIEHIYPVNEIYNSLKSKFPDSKVSLDKYLWNIIIDWS